MQDEERAGRIVEALRARQVMAHLEHLGVYSFGIRVVLPDGRQALWSDDGGTELEAEILSDGDLVGFVPAIPHSEDLDDAGIIEIIANADYDHTD